MGILLGWVDLGGKEEEVMMDILQVHVPQLINDMACQLGGSK